LVSPNHEVSGDPVPEYTPFALFRRLSDPALPGGVATTYWLFPRGHLAEFFDCSPDTAVIVSVPRNLPEVGAGSRIVLDTETRNPLFGALYALVSEEGEIILRQRTADYHDDPRRLPGPFRMVGEVCGFISGRRRVSG
jgi:hypothetical protein